MANLLLPEREALAMASADWVQSDIQNDVLFSPTDANRGYANAAELRWVKPRIQTGMMQARGYNSKPNAVLRPPVDEWFMKPLPAGDKISIDEQELTRRANPRNTPVDLLDDVRRLGLQLTRRATTLLRYMFYRLLAATPSSSVSTVSVTLPNGGTAFTDSYTFQYYTPSTAWSNHAASTPMTDLLTAKNTFQPGSGADFGGAAMALMNPNTAANLYSNANASDFGGLRDRYGATLVFNREVANGYIEAADLPRPVVVKDGWYDDTSTWNYFIPDGKVVIIGYRQPVMDTRGVPVDIEDGTGYAVFTRNVNADTLANLSAPVTSYRETDIFAGSSAGFIVDYLEHNKQSGSEIVSVDVFSLANLLPVILHPNTIGVMSV
jgi:hypothetical protein